MDPAISCHLELTDDRRFDILKTALKVLRNDKQAIRYVIAQTTQPGDEPGGEAPDMGWTCMVCGAARTVDETMCPCVPHTARAPRHDIRILRDGAERLASEPTEAIANRHRISLTQAVAAQERLRDELEALALEEDRAHKQEK